MISIVSLLKYTTVESGPSHLFTQTLPYLLTTTRFQPVPDIACFPNHNALPRNSKVDHGLKYTDCTDCWSVGSNSFLTLLVTLTNKDSQAFGFSVFLRVLLPVLDRIQPISPSPIPLLSILLTLSTPPPNVTGKEYTGLNVRCTVVPYLILFPFSVSQVILMSNSPPPTCITSIQITT